MRPLKLTMRAFGPYAREENIDFSKIGNEQIFVISGKTGAGKTTIFDAMSFALYGKANTNSRDGISLRSHFADNDILTEVELTFRINSNIYKIIRSPQQEVQKKNSEEIRTVNAKAILYKLTDEEVLLASNVREVDEKVIDIVQLDVNQFRQILMIPQNEFRELLVASSKDKQLILQKLAHTYIYKKLEDQLKEGQKAQVSKIENITGQVEQLQTNLVELLNAEIENEDALQDIATFVQIKITEKDQFIKNVEDELNVLVMRIENMTKDIAFAETKLQQWQQLEISLTEKQELKEKYNEMAAIRQRLELNKRTESLKIQESLCQQLREQERNLQEELAKLTANWEQATQSFNEIKEKRNDFLEQLAEQNEHQKALANFEIYEKQIMQIEQSEEKLKSLQTQIIENETKLNEMIAQIADFEVKKQQYQEREATLNEAKLTKKDLENYVAVLEQRLKDLQTQIKVVEQKDKLFAKQEELRQHLITKEQNLEQSQTELAIFEKQKQSQHAIILADALEEGQPCPVCGSVHHPHPITVAADFNEIEYKDKQLESKNLEVEQQTLLSESARLDGMLAQLEQSEVTPLADLQDERQKVESELLRISEQLQFTNKELLSENQNMNNLVWTTKELNGFYQKKEKLQAQLLELRAPAQGIQAQIEMLQKQIPTQYQDKNYFYAKRSELYKIVEQYQTEAKKLDEQYTENKDTVKQFEVEHNLTKRNLQKTESDLKQEQVAFDKAILQADFKDYLAYNSAILTSIEVSDLTNEVQEFEKTFYHNQQVVEQLQKQLEGQEKPNIESLQKTKEAYEVQRRQIIETKTTYHDQLLALNKSFEAYQELNQSLQTEENIYRDLGELADVANGKNERNIGFERYVLGTFLDNILLHTNTRLNKMTNGRFTLLRKDEKAKYNAQSGLDLVVFDEYTGKTRDVTSLSGGESFKTSLALALALAEVVQEMSGGISLETMFIDEGFGTLDVDSLDIAIEALFEAEQSGRLVGIISHVPELKERIPVKLEVIAGNHGSHTKFTKN